MLVGHIISKLWVREFIIVIYLIFICFRFDALTELGAFMRTEFLCTSVFRHQEEEKTDNIKQAQIEQTYEKH